MSITRKLQHRETEDYFIDIISWFISFIFLIACLYPFYYVLIMSFNDGHDAARGGIYFWPRAFSLENYVTFFTDKTWVTAMGITVLRTVLGTGISLLFTCLVAYGYSFRELMFRKVYLSILIVCMYFSGGLIPYYVVLRSLGLINNFLVYIIPGALNTFFILVGITFFIGIPPDLREAALIDGFSELGVFVRVILPISTPFMATLALFAGVGHWNSWFDSAFFIQSNDLRTLGYVLMQVINKNQLAQSSAEQIANRLVTPMSVQMAAMIIAVGPIMCVYPFLQKYFVKGVMIGAVKG